MLVFMASALFSPCEGKVTILTPPVLASCRMESFHMVLQGRVRAETTATFFTAQRKLFVMNLHMKLKGESTQEFVTDGTYGNVL